MANVRFTDNSGETLNALEEAITAALEAMGQQCATYAKQIIAAEDRIATGVMQNSISSLVVSGEKAVHVGTNIRYGKYHEYGTGIYISGGRSTPWAYQDGNGQWHRTRGLPPIHFMRNAAQDNQGVLLKIAERVIKDHMT